MLSLSWPRDQLLVNIYTHRPLYGKPGQLLTNKNISANLMAATQMHVDIVKTICCSSKYQNM